MDGWMESIVYGGHAMPFHSACDYDMRGGGAGHEEEEDDMRQQKWLKWLHLVIVINAFPI